MSRRNLRVLLDLSGPSYGCATIHLDGFLPELVTLRPADVFDVVVDPALAEPMREVPALARLRPRPTRTNRMLRRAEAALLALGRSDYDLLLRPLSREAMPSRCPQMLWDWHAGDAGGRGYLAVPRGRASIARHVMGRSGLVIYPTAAARYAAESVGRTGPGLVLRPPSRSLVADEWPERAGSVRPPGSPGLRVAVPADQRRGQNVVLLPRVSAVLARRGVEHQFLVTGTLPAGLESASISGGLVLDPRDPRALLEAANVAMLPASEDPCAGLMAELEGWGLPVAASDTGSHRELRRRAHLFDPASANGAADALLAAAGQPAAEASPPLGPPAVGPKEYAAAISSEMDRLSTGEGLPWAV